MMQPNIVFLHAHNTGRRVAPYGFAVHTPNLSKLAREGVLFRNAFAAAPTCSPSRSSYLSGCYPHRLGMHGLAHRGFGWTDYGSHLANQLKRAGYMTALAGVEHTAHDPSVIGYDRILFTRDGTDDPTGGSKDAVEHATRFIGEPPAAPFFLSVGIWEAHRPYPEPDPTEPHQDPRYARPPAGIPDTPATRRDAAAYAASVRLMDLRMGAVLCAIERSPAAENTLVFAFADHGLQFPDHMANLTDRGLGVFLLAKGPKGFGGGKVIDQMVSLLDVPATALEVAGVDPSFPIDGRSLSALIAAPERPLHEELFAELTYHAAYEPTRSIRTNRYRYTRRFDGRSAPVLPNIDDSPSKDALLEAGWQERDRAQELLFACTTDRENIANLVTQLPEVATRLRGRLSDWMQVTDDPFASGDTPVIVRGTFANPPDGISPTDTPEPL
jgi:N-sulfoglucosamine sulfohydrolase